MSLDNFGLFFFNIFIGVLNGFIDVLFSPIINGLNNILVSFFGNILIHDVILNFYDVLNNYVIPTFSYFTNLIPPMTWNVILLNLTLYGLIYTFTLTIGLIFKAFRLIKEFVPFA